MKKLRTILFLGVILSMVLFSIPAFGATNGQGGEFVPDQILVKFKHEIPDVAKQKIHMENHASVIGEIRQLGVQVVRIPGGNVSERVQAYLNNPAVEYAEPDYIATAFETPNPNDEFFGEQWGMTKIQAPAAWALNTGRADIKIAILDTGVDQSHPDLLGKLAANKNFTISNTVDDKYGHGTHVAGIAAAVTNNNMGVAGTGYDCSIMNGKVLDDSGSGYHSWIANGITWAADNGAKVINMSLGSSSGSSTLESAVNYAWGKDVVVVAAAGNNGNSIASYPAYYTNCIAVAASDSTDAKASFSNYGEWVDVAAPGVNIYSTMPDHRNRIGLLNYGSLNGTSMATPHVAGLAGLVWATSSYGTPNADVRGLIESTADQAGTMWTTYDIKRINAYRAVFSETTTDTNPPDTFIASGPVNPSSSTSASFSWTGSDDKTLPGDLVYAYSLDGDWSSFTSATSVNYAGLSEGSHKFEVKAKDTAGNVDPTPAAWIWTIDTTPPVISNVNAVPGANTATITWTTNEPADSRVDYGTTTSYGSSVSSAALVTAHSLTLTGLTPATTYRYQVSSKDAAGNPASSTDLFSTAAEAELAVSLTTDKDAYDAANTFVYITVTVTDSTGPVPGMTVDLTVTSPASKTSSYTGTTNSDGKAVFNYRLNKNSKTGPYYVTAKAGTATGTTTFVVN